MKTIGLVGGVASGKSLAARLLVELGAGLLDADQVGHVVLSEDADVHTALRARWGDSVFTPDGTPERRAIARHVFGSDARAAENRAFLENLLHPRIRRRLAALRDQFAAEGTPAVVLDAPLLLEAGWQELCDFVLMIDAPRALRLQRARTRGWSEADFDQREAAQWPIETKRRHANVVIPNDGTAADLRRALSDFWKNYVAC